MPLGHEYEYQYYVVNGTILSRVPDHTCSNLVEKLVLIGAGTNKVVMYQEEDHLKMISIQINLRSVEIIVTRGLVQDNTEQILSPPCISEGQTLRNISKFHEYEYQYYVVNAIILSGETDHTCSNLVEKNLF